MRNNGVELSELLEMDLDLEYEDNYRYPYTSISIFKLIMFKNKQA